ARAPRGSRAPARGGAGAARLAGGGRADSRGARGGRMIAREGRENDLLLAAGRNQLKHQPLRRPYFSGDFGTEDSDTTAASRAPRDSWERRERQGPPIRAERSSTSG